LKRIILAAVVVALAGLTACGSNAAAPAASSASHKAVIVPVSCSQRYKTWTKGQGQALIAALGTASSAEAAGDTQVLTATLKKMKSSVAWAAKHPVPACADPMGYWDVLFMHVTAAAANTRSVSNIRASMKGVPQIERRLTAELKAL
jgi:carboxylesterase type B